jgi:hypothetical protein
MRDFDTVGSKLGPKIAKLISQTIIATKRGMLPTEHNMRVMATQTVIDNAGREVAEHYRPVIRKILDADDGNLDADMRMFLEEAISGEHQLKAIGGLLMGPAGGTIGTFISNLLAPVLYAATRTMPQLHVDVQTLANGVAERVFTDADGADKASGQGIDNGQFNKLVEMALAYPPVADALDMWRRGIISEQQFVLCLERSAVPGQFINAFAATKNVPLPPDLAALAVLRGIIDQAEGQKISAQSGVSAADFQIMIDDTGEPLGLEQLLDAYRRGYIDKATLERGIRQSRVRNEWIPTAEALRFTPMSVADAVNAVVQNHLSQAQAAAIAEQNGLTPGAVDTLILTAGEPLSRTEMEELYNRGIVTRDDVLQALRESRLKNKYGADAFDLHVRLLEPRILSSAVEYGAVSHADAVKRALEYGFSTADAEILVGEGSARKLQTYRNRVVASAETLYEASGITEAQFRAVAKSAGFDQAETDYLVQGADYRKREKQLAATISAVRSKFIGHHLTQNQASAILDKAGLLAGQRDNLIATWKTEQSATIRQLTEAQIIHAMKKQVLTVQEADDRLVRMGYSQIDAAILIESA